MACSKFDKHYIIAFHLMAMFGGSASKNDGWRAGRRETAARGQLESNERN
jgi:hypothetical protein